MKIDRHNYEEFFILYWDEELPASQKQAVENFVKENTDLQEEFKILGETRFTPDKNVQLEEKEFLLNNSFINITNYEEQVLNYIDDELSNDERKEVERSAAKFPTIQKELAFLQKTKLQPEAEVIFPDKSTLYRREEKPDSYGVRVISMTWFRVAVAATIILIAGFVTLRLVNSNEIPDTPPVATIDNSKDPQSNRKNDTTIIQPGNQPVKDQEQPFVKTGDEATQGQKKIENDRKKSVKQDDVPKSSIAYKPENKNRLSKEGTVANAKPDEPVYSFSKDNNKAEKLESDKTNNFFINSSVTDKAQITYNKKTPEPLEIEKHKEKDGGGLKELLRKTARVFERRTKIQTTTEDNKLLVGAFAVSLK